MTDILDAEELEAAIANADDLTRFWRRNADSELILAAARAHLATLPRWEEVKMECWGLMSPRGYVVTVFDKREEAEHHASWFRAPHTIIRLTGTAKVRA